MPTRKDGHVYQRIEMLTMTTLLDLFKHCPRKRGTWHPAARGGGYLLAWLVCWDDFSSLVCLNSRNTLVF